MNQNEDKIQQILKTLSDEKLLINSERKEKSQKNIESIKYVLNFVLLSNKYKKNLKDIFTSLPKKWKKRIILSAKSNGVDVFDIAK